LSILGHVLIDYSTLFFRDVSVSKLQKAPCAAMIEDEQVLNLLAAISLLLQLTIVCEIS